MATLVHSKPSPQLTTPSSLSSAPRHSAWTWLLFAILFCLLIVSRITTVQTHVAFMADSPQVVPAESAPVKPVVASPYYTASPSHPDSGAL